MYRTDSTILIKRKILNNTTDSIILKIQETYYNAQPIVLFWKYKRKILNHMRDSAIPEIKESYNKTQQIELYQYLVFWK